MSAVFQLGMQITVSNKYSGNDSLNHNDVYYLFSKKFWRSIQ